MWFDGSGRCGAKDWVLSSMLEPSSRFDIGERVSRQATAVPTRG